MTMEGHGRRGLSLSLSAKLLLLTIGFVMLAEVLIYAPSIGRFRLTYLEEQLDAAHLAILTLDATPDQMVSEPLEQELLSHVGAYVVALTRPNQGRLMLMSNKPEGFDAAYDLREAGFFRLIGDAFATLLVNKDRVLRVLGPSPKDPDVLVEIIIEEAPMRREMIAFSGRILGLSLIISLITASLVYFALHWLLVRPMRQITESIVAFRDNPEDVGRIIEPSMRRDEVGTAQRALADMQRSMRATLHQRAHLAALGTAVTKINHDLKNILATASLVSDRLAHSDDPQVKSATPTLMAALDRAIRLCTHTLDYTRNRPPELMISHFQLAGLVREACENLPNGNAGEKSIVIANGADLEIEGDREQLLRVITNLAQNALQAGASRIWVEGRSQDNEVEIDVVDDGPGLQPRAREQLFKAFSGSARPGGTGLGLPIARELMRAHGGDVQLINSDGEGTRFRLMLPARRHDA